jgi:hypothetical protein
MLKEKQNLIKLTYACTKKLWRMEYMRGFC